MLTHDIDLSGASADATIPHEPAPLFDGVDLAALAVQMGTPLHAYSASAIRASSASTSISSGRRRPAATSSASARAAAAISWRPP